MQHDMDSASSSATSSSATSSSATSSSAKTRLHETLAEKNHATGHTPVHHYNQHGVPLTGTNAAVIQKGPNGGGGGKEKGTCGTAIRETSCGVCECPLVVGHGVVGSSNAAKGYLCPNCQAATYCTRKCQKKDWAAHKLVCASLKLERREKKKSSRKKKEGEKDVERSEKQVPVQVPPVGDDADGVMKAMSVKELKKLISSAGMSWKTCVEKSDLRARAIEASKKLSSMKQAKEQAEEQAQEQAKKGDELIEMIRAECSASSVSALLDQVFDDAVARGCSGEAAVHSVIHHIGQMATPLICAVMMTNESIVALLLRRNADVDQAPTIKQMDDQSIVNGATTALNTAARLGHNRIVCMLLEHNASINLASPISGDTPLIEAAGEGRASTIKLLIKHGAEVDLASPISGVTALYHASDLGHESVVSVLLDLNASVDKAVPDQGCTPLHVACEKGHRSIVEMLLKHKASTSQVKKDDGFTPLLLAARHGHPSIVKTLLEHNADVEKVTANNGRSPLWEAVANGHESVMHILLKNQAFVDHATTGEGVRDVPAKGVGVLKNATPLHIAILYGHINLVRALADQYGADTSLHACCCITNNGLDLPLSPIQLATQRKGDTADEVVSFLHECALRPAAERELRCASLRGDLARTQAAMEKHGDELLSFSARKLMDELIEQSKKNGHVEVSTYLINLVDEKAKEMAAALFEDEQSQASSKKTMKTKKKKKKKKKKK